MGLLPRVLALMIAAGLAGCGADKDPAMPDVVGKKLDVAESDIKRAGFEDDVDVLGGGLFGVIDESNWEVCEQTPSPGEPLTKSPRLKVERNCDKDDSSSEEPSPEPEVTESAPPAAEATQRPTPRQTPPPKQAVDITVDELLDKLNSENQGGIKLGDRFKVTDELSGSEYWGNSQATGDYIVNLKAKDGAQDLPFFVDETETKGWRDGTVVELVLENVERTINGESDDGYLQAVAVKTIRR